MKQISFDFFEELNEYNINDFIICSENIEAFYYINQDNEYNNLSTNQYIFLSGERKSGKTFLAHIWKQKNNAKFIDNNIFNLRFEDFVIKVNSLIDNFDYYIIDDLDKNINEEKLFFILNTVSQHNSKILITSNFCLSKLKINLKDLKSRINSGVFLKIKKFSKEIKPMLILRMFVNKKIIIGSQLLKLLVKKLPNDYEGIFNKINYIISKKSTISGKITTKFVKDILNI